MPTLNDAFMGARDRHDAVPAIAGLESTLAELVARGNAAHLELRLDAAFFSAHLGRCGAPVETLPAAEIHAEDLFLAAAALYGDGTAAAKLRRLYRSVVAGAVETTDPSVALVDVDQVEDRLWRAALVGFAGAPPELAAYSGRGTLAEWVGIAARRIALAPISGKLPGRFQGALTQALVGLEDRERMIYRLHVANGMTVEMIARVYRVSHDTISRWLTKARDSVIRETQRLLHEEVTLSPAEFESMAARVVSQLDLGVSRILRDRM
jgi:RNA polymerase sigma-70 factor (ECF subfamily)